jgi:hypothetical protein
MRGFPLLRLALVAAALALLAFPVHRLTRDKPAVSKPSEASIPEKNATFHVVLTTSTPAVLRVMAANQPTASSERPVTRFETAFTMNADQPEDLAVFAEFSDKAAPHAVRVEVHSGEKLLADSTFWGTGLVEDVLEIPEP